jgi:hypothetical protein
MVGVLKHGVQSEDNNDAVVIATVDLPAGTSRKLVVAGMYWASGSDLTVSAATYDGNAMTLINSISQGSFNEMFLYRYDIPDADEGEKVISFTFSASVNIKAIAFAILDDAATGAPESNDTDSGTATLTDSDLLLNNTTADSFSVGFDMADITNTPRDGALAVAEQRIRRYDLARDGLAHIITVIIADRGTSGSHRLSIDHGVIGSRSFVTCGATFAKN